MAAEIITKEDLEKFKQELLREIGEIISKSSPSRKQWLKSADVMKLLQISHGTLQSLRTSGELPYTKTLGTIYYLEDDIVKMMEKNKKNYG